MKEENQIKTSLPLDLRKGNLFEKTSEEGATVANNVYNS